MNASARRPVVNLSDFERSGEGCRPVQAADRGEADKRSGLAAATSQPAATSGSTQRRSQSHLVLRVLTGLQQGAEARMKHQRLLVGNLQSECDVVLDVGRAQPHTCLIRASADGWSVLATAGDLWRGQTWLAPHEAHAISSGDVLTLGEVSFCIADTRIVDWSQVEAPATAPALPSTLRATSAAGVAVVAGNRSQARPAPVSGRPVQQLVPQWNASLERCKQALGFAKGTQMTSSSPPRPIAFNRILMGLILAIGIALAGLAAYLTQQASQQPVTAMAARDVTAAARALLATLPWASELTVQPDAFNPRRVLLGGYLPERRQITELEAALRQSGLEPEHRWVAVNELSLDLSQRLSLSADELRYAGRGGFAIDAVSNQMEALDRAIRRILQDSPAVNAVSVHFSDKLSTEATALPSPPTIRYQRAQDQPGGVTVTGLEALRPAQKLQRYVVRELRLGALPSVVLDNGARYFEGSSLPGGATLVQISAQQILVQAGAESQSFSIDAGVQVAGKAQMAAARKPSQAPQGL